MSSIVDQTPEEEPTAPSRSFPLWPQEDGARDGNPSSPTVPKSHLGPLTGAPRTPRVSVSRCTIPVLHKAAVSSSHVKRQTTFSVAPTARATVVRPLDSIHGPRHEISPGTAQKKGRIQACNTGRTDLGSRSKRERWNESVQGRRLNSDGRIREARDAY